MNFGNAKPQHNPLYRNVCLVFFSSSLHSFSFQKNNSGEASRNPGADCKVFQLFVVWILLAEFTLFHKRLCCDEFSVTWFMVRCALPQRVTTFGILLFARDQSDTLWSAGDVHTVAWFKQSTKRLQIVETISVNPGRQHRVVGHRVCHLMCLTYPAVRADNHITGAKGQFPASLLLSSNWISHWKRIECLKWRFIQNTHTQENQKMRDNKENNDLFSNTSI